jgi:hypothetical protein
MQEEYIRSQNLVFWYSFHDDVKTYSYYLQYYSYNNGVHMLL